MEVRPARTASTVDDFEQEASAVFQAFAITIVAPVHIREQKLRKYVAGLAYQTLFRPPASVVQLNCGGLSAAL